MQEFSKEEIEKIVKQLDIPELQFEKLEPDRYLEGYIQGAYATEKKWQTKLFEKLLEVGGWLDGNEKVLHVLEELLEITHKDTEKLFNTIRKNTKNGEEL